MNHRNWAIIGIVSLIVIGSVAIVLLLDPFNSVSPNGETIRVNQTTQQTATGTYVSTVTVTGNT